MLQQQIGPYSSKKGTQAGQVLYHTIGFTESYMHMEEQDYHVSQV